MNRHVPVLSQEAIDYLQLKPNQNVIDCTLGDAGHSEAMLQKIAPKGKLLGIDLDAEAVLRSKRFLYSFEDRAIIVRDNFANLKTIAEKNDFKQINGILMDLGWSTPQFEERGRGFSFSKDEPLDMRYSTTEQETVADIVNSYSENDLAGIFKNFGEEKLNKEIAEAIVDFRKIKKIEKTGELTEIVLQVYRIKLRTDKEIPWIGGLHPATKVFQALRMEVNHELENLKSALPQAVDLLASGGRLAVITFHSLEDRIVKHYFKSIAGKTAKLVFKKPISASDEEIKLNPRARSAKLRVIEKN
ncbi:MAG: Ribosomal RNA small subunit methyltransferase H [Parcubacteria group bacterium Gr01-1014_13]|nr:MAG: Ribosomal RNA small subunit methyltransferase H [Parcubacteria group bacterium Gr01-1014_13]